MAPMNDGYCFCLTLRSATIIIGSINCIQCLGLIICTSFVPACIDNIPEESMKIATKILINFIYLTKLIASTLLLSSVVMKIQSHAMALPWLWTQTFEIIVVVIIFIIVLLFGTTMFKLTSTMCVSLLVLLGLHIILSLFFWINVLSYRENLIEALRQIQTPQERLSISPPPAYEDLHYE